MKDKNFYLFLSFILGFLLVGTVAFSYFFGNFGGISIKELHDEYLLKEELIFSDLPAEEQDKYRDIGIIQASDGLENLLGSLQEKIAFLEKENMLLSADKNELLKIVEHEKSKSSTAKKNILSSNLEKINEAEKQHYKNIHKLTKKINELHRENISLVDRLNKKESSSTQDIEKLKKQIKEERAALKKNEIDFAKMSKLEIAAIEKKNERLEAKLDNFKNDLKIKEESFAFEQGKKDQKIALLQNKLNEMMLEKNSLLMRNSQILIEVEKENSKKMQNINNIVKNINNEKKAIEDAYKKSVKKVEDKYKNSLASQKKELETLRTRLALEEEKNRLEVSRLKKELSSLSASRSIALSEIDKNRASSALDKDRLLQLEDKIDDLESNKKSVEDEIDKFILKNEAIHNKNYKILNKKIAQLERENRAKSLISNEQLLVLSKDKKELNSKISSLLDKNSKKELKIDQLKSKIAELENDKNMLEMSEDKKMVKIKNSFSELKSSVTLREQEYQKVINELKETLLMYDDEVKKREKDKEKLGNYAREITHLNKIVNRLENEDRQAKDGNKLQKLGSVECADMLSGSFEISSICKSKVDEFLSLYDETHYFEVIPIVGRGGFASLNKVQRDGRLGIPDSEIKRLTRLANIGLARDRAKEGGWLIRDKFGDDVKISYTVYSIEADDKRGFVIRAYR